MNSTLLALLFQFKMQQDVHLILIWVCNLNCSGVGICQKADIFSMCHLRWVKYAQEGIVIQRSLPEQTG